MPKPEDTLRPDDVKPKGELPIRDAGTEREPALRRTQRDASDRGADEPESDRPKLGNLHDPGE